MPFNNSELTKNNIFAKKKKNVFPAIKNEVPTAIFLNKTDNKNIAISRPKLLSLDEEKRIVQALIQLANFGFGFNNKNFLSIMENFFNLEENETRREKFGYEWLFYFKKRWQINILEQINKNIPITRNISCTAKVLISYFSHLKDTIKKLDIENLPINIWSCDEYGFQCDQGISNIICKRNDKKASSISGNSQKQTFSTLFCCNAFGDFLPPLIVYKAQYACNSWSEYGPNGAKYKVSKSGWMEEPNFYDWLTNIFIKETEHLKGNKVLILDGHTYHISLRVIESALANKIMIICLPENSSRILQPLDFAINKSLKLEWKNALENFYQKNKLRSVDKTSFAGLLKSILNYKSLKKNATYAFAKSGIFPLNPIKNDNFLFRNLELKKHDEILETNREQNTETINTKEMKVPTIVEPEIKPKISYELYKHATKLPRKLTADDSSTLKNVNKDINESEKYNSQGSIEKKTQSVNVKDNMNMRINNQYAERISAYFRDEAVKRRKILNIDEKNLQSKRNSIFNLYGRTNSQESNFDTESINNV